MINKIARKIYNQYRLSIIAKRIFDAALTDQQKTLVDDWAEQRKSGLSFGPMFKSDRTYFNLGKSSLSVIQMPEQIYNAIDKEGYYCPDYRSGYVYKKDDKLKSKPVKLIKILRKGINDNDQFNDLKKKFDQRISTSRKQMKSCVICITHNPYDVAGMSTDRNWTSCMDLNGGAYSSTALKQVKYGGMCAYLIYDDDAMVERPLARIAIKRLESDSGNFIYVAQNKIYGDVQFANELNFMREVIKILEDSNNKTMGEAFIFNKKDDGSYSDAGIYRRYLFKSDEQMMKYINGNEGYFTDEDFLNAIDLDRLHYLFPYLMKFFDMNLDFVFKLAKNRKLTQEQRKQFVQKLFSNFKLYKYQLHQLFINNLLNDGQIQRFVDEYIKSGEYAGNFAFFIAKGKINDDLKNKLVDIFIEDKCFVQLSDFIIKNKLNSRLKKKVIDFLFQNECYDQLIQLYNDNKLDNEYKNILKQKVKKCLYDLDNYKGDYDILFNSNIIDEKDRDLMISYFIKSGLYNYLYYIIKEQELNDKLTDKQRDDIIQYFIKEKLNDELQELVVKYESMISEKQKSKIYEFLGLPQTIQF